MIKLYMYTFIYMCERVCVCMYVGCVFLCVCWYVRECLSVMVLMYVCARV